MTSLNQNILNMVRNSSGHLTAEEAFLLAKKSNIDVSVASIYRILGKLADEGFIRRIAISDGPDIFDKTLENHEHLICSKCGKIKDVNIGNLMNKLVKETGIEIEDYDLTLKYICEECKQKGKK